MRWAVLALCLLSACSEGEDVRLSAPTTVQEIELTQVDETRIDQLEARIEGLEKLVFALTEPTQGTSPTRDPRIAGAHPTARGFGAGTGIPPTRCPRLLRIRRRDPVLEGDRL